MSGVDSDSLRRERDHQRARADALGARVTALEGEHGRLRTAARRGLGLARLVREIYETVDDEAAPEEVDRRLGDLLARALDGSSAALWSCGSDGRRFQRLARSPEADLASFELDQPPRYLAVDPRVGANPAVDALRQAAGGVARFQWAYEKLSGLAVIVADHNESAEDAGGDRTGPLGHAVADREVSEEPEILFGALAVLADVRRRNRAKSLLRANEEQYRRLAERLMAAQAEAERAALAAQAASRAKSHFLATVSHELRTPLNAILGFSEIIAGQVYGAVGHGKYLEYAQDIHASGQHLLELIDEILDISKIEAGKLDMAPTDLDVRRLLETCVRLLRVRAAERGLELVLRVAPDTPTVHADERAFKQIIFNLLTNAIKFTPSGGTVGVATRRMDESHLEVTVSDTGIGIPNDQIERVLRPFEQIDNRYSREAGGTGLGLSLVKSLVELHGGTLTIDSTVDVGTTVTVAFPLRGVLGPIGAGSSGLIDSWSILGRDPRDG